MNSTNLAIPISIVIAGAIIAGALYFGIQTSGNVAANAPQPQAAIDESA